MLLKNILIIYCKFLAAEEAFNKCDKDHNQAITFAEFKKAVPGVMEHWFTPKFQKAYAHKQKTGHYKEVWGTDE